MSDQSPNLALPLLLPAQAQKHVTHNEALSLLDLLVQLRIASFDAVTPPDQPADGEIHALASGATGAWAGQDGMLAAWVGGGWVFVPPRDGWRAWDAEQGGLRVFDGGTWSPLQAAPASAVPELGINTGSDAVNRLAVASQATLFSHEGSGHQLKLNKAAEGDTASLLFQTAWSGRAEMGTAGNDDWSIKVSPDGSTWTEALRIDAATGRASGSAVMQSAEDNSEYALLRWPAKSKAEGGAGQEGIFGLGREDRFGLDTNPDLALATGFYKQQNQSADAPLFRPYIHVTGNPDFHAQLFLGRSNEADALYYRSTVHGQGMTWDVGRLVYTQASILGTVSQSGGTPTGALFESGSGPNGRYLRLADGTQICWHSLNTAPVQTAAGSGYASDSDTTWTFPAVFDDCALVLADAGALGRWASCGTPTSTNVVVRQHAWTSFSGAESVRVAAFGTWS